jgi:hypothetical protein
MGAYDHLIPQTAPVGNDYAHLVPDTPEGAGGVGSDTARAPGQPDLTREYEIRHQALAKLLQEHPQPGYPDRFADSASMHMIHPVLGLKGVVEGKANEWFRGAPPATVGEYWRGNVGASKDLIRQAEANTPGPKGTAVDIAGAVATGRGGPKILTKGGQAMHAFGQGVIGGAADNPEDTASATKGGLIGGAVNAVTSTTLNALLDRFTRGARKEIGVASRGGNSQQMLQEGSDIFTKLDNAGIHYKPKDITPLVGNAVQRLADVGFNANMQKQLTPAISEIGAFAGKPTTWTQLRNMQSQVAKLKASPDTNLRRVAGELDDEINQFVQTAKPTMPAASVAAGVNPAADVEEAKRLWATGKYSGKMEGMAEAAAGAANPAEATSGVFKRYSDAFVKNPDKYRPGTPEQWRLMDVIGAGDPKTSGLAKGLDRWGGSLARYGAAGTAAGVGLPYLIGNDPGGAGGVSSTAGGTLLMAGLLSKYGARGLRTMIAERGAERVNDLLRNIATGKTAPDPNAYVPRDALARIIAKQDVAQGLGNYATGFVDTGMPQP